MFNLSNMRAQHVASQTRPRCTLLSVAMYRSQSTLPTREPYWQRMFLQKPSDLTVGRQVSFNQTLVAILFTNVDDAARKHCSRYTETSSFPIRCIATGARDIKEPSASEDQDERTIYQRCDCCVEVGANGDQADSASPISH